MLKLRDMNQTTNYWSVNNVCIAGIGAVILFLICFIFIPFGLGKLIGLVPTWSIDGIFETWVMGLTLPTIAIVFIGLLVLICFKIYMFFC